jgi:hypothetical protein
VQTASAGGSVAAGSTTAATTAPGATTGAVGQPGGAGSGPAEPSGSASTSVDSANALRAAGLACGDTTNSERENGLAAVTPEKRKESDRQKAACPPAESRDQTENKTTK